MKILLITDLYPLGEENIAKTLYYFVREWQNQGHIIEVIRTNFILNTFIRGRKLRNEQIYFEDGIKIYNLNFHTPFLFNVYDKLPEDFSLKNYDVMISHMPCGALAAEKLLKKDKIKYICAVHCSDIHVLTNFKYALYFRNRIKNAYKTADKIAARSYILQKKITEILPQVRNKTFTAFSGLDNKFIDELPKSKDMSGEEIQISAAASLIKRKNIDIIIKALYFINKNFHFTVIGSGSERKKLEKLAKKLNLENKITFTGRVSREEVMQYLRKSDIFVLLSDCETFGLCYLEAMAAGNIIIAKKNDGIDGILRDGENAFLIEPSVKELKKCLEKIIAMNNSEISALQANSRKTIKNLSISKAAKNYIDNIKI